MDHDLDQIYNEAFEREYTNLTLRKAADPEFTREYLTGLLQSMYVNQGNNYMDRTDAKDSVLRAMIAACETLLSEWEA